MIPETVDLVLYHGGCPDGFAAAHVATKRYGRQIEIQPMYFGKTTPVDLVTDRHVLVVDFSWKRGPMQELIAAAKSLAVFDHHITAQKELDGLPGCTFDMARSGASLTWDLLFPDLRRPWWVDYVEDRDLGRAFNGNGLPHSLAINAYLMAVPRTYEAWANMIEPLDAVTALQLGNAITLHIDHYIEGVLEQKQLGVITAPNGVVYTIGIVNAPYLNLSDVGMHLLSDAQIGMGWFERADGLTQFGLRSRGDIDVSAIAKSLGGGGHVNAAGFQIPIAEARHLVDTLLGRHL